MKSQLTLNGNGSFHITNVTSLSYTYFPLCNTKAMKSSIGPTLSGDAKKDQHSFLLLPVTIEDLDQSPMKRNMYFRVNDSFTWSVTGQTPTQILTPDKVDLYGDFLVHKIVRKHALFTCVIESFVPANDAYQELHKITMTNTKDKPLKIKGVVGVPIFGRSAANIRDHRHVTSLLNRVKITEQGVINHPTFSFDERGHTLNDVQYAVFAKSTHHENVHRFHPTLETFKGEGQTLLDPQVVKEDVENTYQPDDVVEGYEAMAGMAYEPVSLKPGDSMSFVLSLGIATDEAELLKMSQALSVETFEALKDDTKQAWKRQLAPLSFQFTDTTLNGWLKWVTLQPILRRIYGNSFMPHHDYGLGGKGWRDLWQDLLALILMDPSNVKDMLVNNFKGVRIDGSNATIIGDEPGVFLADRNNIARTWMDHGSWPLLTTKLYLDHSGDLALLFEQVPYFQDQFTHYTKKVIKDFEPGENSLKTTNHEVYQGSVFEHLLLQNIVPYYNVGKHNNIRLEDADWNDGLDMASQQGESVAFTAFYGQNLKSLADMLTTLAAQGVETITLLKELDLLLEPVAQDAVQAKQARLKRYFDIVASGITGKKTTHKTKVLAERLGKKGEALLNQVQTNEWLEDGDEGWFNGYYDNDALPLDDVKNKDMTLTGQVFAIMSGAATDSQIKTIINSADQHLYDQTVGGYKLNTNFNEVKTNMGRLFGFAYGHKENGAMFSHMAVMYANALYKRGFVEAGYKVIDAIYRQSMNLEKAKMYPGIPEYFDPKGRGMYSYLTGSASWMILTMITEVFGVKGDVGLPVFEPKLLKTQFNDQTELTINTILHEQPIKVTYQNPLGLSFGAYEIETITVDQKHVAFTRTTFGVKLNHTLHGEHVIIKLNHKKESGKKT